MRKMKGKVIPDKGNDIYFFKGKMKIIYHIVCLCLFIFGMILIHTVLNSNSDYFKFFNLRLHRVVVIDTAILFIGVSFFCEFYLTFKPIQIRG